MIPFTLNQDGFLHTFLLCPDEDDDQRLIQQYAETRPNSIYFFADLCEPAEPERLYFNWREHPLIGGELLELRTYSRYIDDYEKVVSQAAEENPDIIYFYVEKS